MNATPGAVEVEGGWATYTKTPRVLQGYKVDSARADRALAGHLTGVSASMGTPCGPRGGHHDELPWFSFTGGGPDGPPVAALTSLEWSEQVDGTGQPIAPTRAIWFDWDTATARRLTYHALLQRFRELTWPRVDSGPAGASGHRVRMAAPESDWRRVPTDIETFGTEMLIDIAGALAARVRVVVRLGESEDLSHEQRTRFLDAAVALLPFGVRNGMTASTWASYQSSHAADLTFAAEAHVGETCVSLRDRTVRPIMSGGIGGRYADELRKCLAEGHSLASIVERLRRSDEPAECGRTSITEPLSRMRLPKVVHRELAEGKATVARVDAALAELAVSQVSFPAEYRAEAVRFLATGVHSADKREAKSAREALRRHWREDYGSLLGALCRAPGTTVEHAAQWWAFTLAAEGDGRRASTAFLIAASTDPPVQAADPAFETLVGLFLRCLATARSLDARSCTRLLSQPDPLAHAVTASVLRTNVPGRLAALLPQRSMLRIINDNLNGLYDAAREDRTASWLYALLCAAHGDSASIEPHGVARIYDLGLETMTCFVRVLTAKVARDDAVEILGKWSTGVLAAPPTEPERERIRAVGEMISAALAGHRPHLSDSARARVDVWDLTFGSPPHQLGIEAAAPLYLRVFQRSMVELDTHWRGIAVERLTDFLIAAEARLAHLDAGLLDLIHIAYLERLAPSADAMPVADFLALEQRLPAHWWSELVERPASSWYHALRRLEELAAHCGEYAAVAEAATATLANPGAVTEVTAALERYLIDAGPECVDLLLRTLEKKDDTLVAQVVDDVLDALVSDACGAAAKEKFVAHVAAEHTRYARLAQRCADRGAAMSTASVS